MTIDELREISRENQRKAEALYDEWRAEAVSKGIYWTAEQQSYHWNLACDMYFG